VAGKIKTAAQVVGSIPDGAHIALGGFAIARGVIAIAHELIRQNKRNLTVSQGVAGLDTDWTSLSLCFRYLAGALGLSFIPIKSLLASEILDRLEKGGAKNEVARMTCPFTGESYVAMTALTPDVSFVHVQVADAEGNCRIDGPRWENEEQAKAARRLIVIAEEIVPTSKIQEQPERTIVPAHRVEAVIHLPFGAHPTAVYGRYDYDGAHLKLYVEHSKRADRIGDYIRSYILETKDHAAYLEKVGMAQVERLKADPARGY
jgi:glutaconate CoA-transferase, subunit A